MASFLGSRKKGGAGMAKIVCTSCGYIGYAKTVTKGSFFIELVLWLCFLIPGLIYSIWRLTTKCKACPSCNQATIIPADSPMAKKFLEDNFPHQNPVDDARGATFEAGKAFQRWLRKFGQCDK